MCYYQSGLHRRSSAHGEGESLSSGGSGTIGALHGYSYTYSYDAAGNRASKYNGTSTETYAYDNANKLTSAGVKSYSYDSAGNCTSVYNSTSGVTVTLAYDGENRMKSASDSASTFSDTYSYNGLDQRVGKVDNTGTFAYTRDGDEVDDSVLADGAAVYNHGAGGNSLISENRSGTSKYYHSDALGSTGALTNSSEGVTDTHVTDAFGMAVTGTGTTPTPFGFVGQGGYQSDADTGLMLCGHRYYDDSTGRFVSRDPVQAGENWYTYCGGDPINSSDPTGLVHIVITIGSGGLGVANVYADAGDLIPVENGIPGYQGPPSLAKGGELITSMPVSNIVPDPDADPTATGGGGPFPDGTYPIAYMDKGRGMGPHWVHLSGAVVEARGTWFHSGKGEEWQKMTGGCVRGPETGLNQVNTIITLNNHNKHNRLTVTHTNTTVSY